VSTPGGELQDVLVVEEERAGVATRPGSAVYNSLMPPPSLRRRHLALAAAAALCLAFEARAGSDSDIPSPLVAVGKAAAPGVTLLSVERSVYDSLLFEFTDTLNMPLGMWSEIIPGLGPFKLIRFAKAGKVADKWFSPISPGPLQLSLINRLATNYIVYMGRIWGTQFPAPDYVSNSEARRVSQGISESFTQSGGSESTTTHRTRAVTARMSPGATAGWPARPRP